MGINGRHSKTRLLQCTRQVHGVELVPPAMPSRPCELSSFLQSREVELRLENTPTLACLVAVHHLLNVLREIRYHRTASRLCLTVGLPGVNVISTIRSAVTVLIALPHAPKSTFILLCRVGRLGRGDHQRLLKEARSKTQ
ncbi:hypothetical protein EDB85DRAFT_1897375 [Lactarius pseudohatsudake]|nr:hypothetical protein EDB85DRAFT_1897375 [Lactarius pseudohatsudake]